MESVIGRYFEAWNCHDAAGIVGCFAEGGTYADPSAGELTGPAIAAYAEQLWEAFPDLRFEIGLSAAAGPDAIAAEWTMRGTNLGPFGELPPSGKRVTVRGADFIATGGGKIRSVRGYFDQRSIPDQLGLQCIVQPGALGHFEFGTAVAVHSGRREEPGAFTITAMRVRSEAESERVRSAAREIALRMREMRGFIGWTGITLGDRLITVTAWERAEDGKQLSTDARHRSAIAEVHRHAIGESAVFGTWVKSEVRPPWIRCPSCDRMGPRPGSTELCGCGARLPERLAYW
jgi:steroid delta-isomerase-like uncharacterized protein